MWNPEKCTNEPIFKAEIETQMQRTNTQTNTKWREGLDGMGDWG